MITPTPNGEKSRNAERQSIIGSANTQVVKSTGKIGSDVMPTPSRNIDQREHKSQSRMRLSATNDFSIGLTSAAAANILTP